MKNTTNFERVKDLMDDWPSWKRNYKLTKNSKTKEEPNALKEEVAGLNEEATTLSCIELIGELESS